MALEVANVTQKNIGICILLNTANLFSVCYNKGRLVRLHANLGRMSSLVLDLYNVKKKKKSARLVIFLLIKTNLEFRFLDIIKAQNQRAHSD